LLDLSAPGWSRGKARQKSAATLLGKKRPTVPFEGLWHIVSMTGWDEDYFSEEVQAFVEFKSGTDHFQFGYVHGYMDWRPGTREGQSAVEWTWEGTISRTRVETWMGENQEAGLSLGKGCRTYFLWHTAHRSNSNCR
jgi:hypothetical protein